MKLPGIFCLLIAVAASTGAQVRIDESAECARLRAAGTPCVAAPVTARIIGGPNGFEKPPPVRAAAAARPTPPVVIPIPSAPGKGIEAWLSTLPGIPLGMTQSSREAQEPGQVIVYWPRSFDAEAALAALASERKVVPFSTTMLENLGGVLAVFQLRTHAAAAEFRDRLTREFPDAVVDFNTRYRPLQQSPPTVSQPRIYLPQKIDMPKPADRGAVQSTVRVGIVDGPIATIAALSSVAIVRKNFLLATDTPSPAGHATSIAALVAGRDANAGFVGIAPHAVLYSAEIMRSRGREDTTTSAALVLALEWMLSERVKIINLSLGGPGDLVMAHAFARLTNLAVIVVAAAGNGGPTAAPAYPAAYPGIIAVTATDALDDLYADANHGTYITLAAPGVDLWVPDSGQGHYVSGTSFSAAVVTASAAALLTQKPQLGPRAVVQRMCQSAKDLGAKGVDSAFGCGLIQLGALLREDL